MGQFNWCRILSSQTASNTTTTDISQGGVEDQRSLPVKNQAASREHRRVSKNVGTSRLSFLPVSSVHGEVSNG